MKKSTPMPPRIQKLDEGKAMKKPAGMKKPSKPAKGKGGSKKAGC